MQLFFSWFYFKGITGYFISVSTLIRLQSICILDPLLFIMDSKLSRLKY